MNKLFKMLATLSLLLAITFLVVSCAREKTRTDISLQMTEEDSVESIVERELETAGSTFINIDEDAGLPDKSTVTYVDHVDMDKAVVVESDIQETIADAKDETFDASEFETGVVVLDEPVIDVSIEDPTTDAEVTVADEAVKDIQTAVDLDDEVEDVAVSVEDILGPASGAMTDSADDTAADTDMVDEELYTEAEVVEEPSLPKTNYPRHTVKRGDTVWSISHDYGCTMSEIFEANNISRHEVLRVGQFIIIPKKEKTEDETKEIFESPATKNVAAEKVITKEEVKAVPQGETEFYTVQSGDSYWRISRKYGISVSELMALNDTSNEFLRAGQKILVPKK